MKKIGYFCFGFVLFAGWLRADQNLAGNVTITGGAAAGKLNVTGALNVVGAIDSDSNTFTFGTQSTSYGAALLYLDNAVDTLSFSINRSPASWLFVHNANIAAMRLDSAHQLSLYRADGTTAGLTFTPQTGVIKLGTNTNATLTGNDTTGLISAAGPLTVAGAFTATSGITNTTGAFGGPSALNFTAGGTNQNITLTPSGTGYTILNGNVGIGVAAPAAKLDVLGTTKFLASTGFYGTRIGSSSGGDSFVWLGSRVGVPVIQGNNQAFTGALPLALQAEGGNVGIGTTTPNYALSFGPTLGKVIALFENSGTNLYGISAAGAGTGTDPYRLKLFSNGAEAMSLTSAGNVGVGTATPYAKLAAVGNISAGSAASAAAGTNLASITASATKSQLYLIRSVGTWADTWWEWTHDNDNKLKLGFSTVPQAEFANGSASFFGYVGIGPAAPAAKLHVQRDGAVATDYSLSQLFVGGTDGNKRLAVAYDTTNNVGLIQAYVNGGAVQNIALQSAGGNVGIGTTTPASKLQLTGENVELSMGRTSIDTTPYTRFGMTTGYDTYWTSNATYSTGAWNYVSTAGWGSQATRIDQMNGTIQFDTTSGGVNPITWSNRLYIANNGNVGIGTMNPGTYKLAVNGTIHTQGVVVDTSGWSDYVFDQDYRLAPLSEVEAHIKAHKHLPGIPSAADVAEHGVSVGDMQSKLLGKIEELTLHLIRIEKENAELRQRVQKLEKIP